MKTTLKTTRNAPWRLTLATLALAFGAAMIQPAFAATPQPVGEPGARHAQYGVSHMKRMLDGIDATDAQRQQIAAIRQSARSDLKPIQDSRRQLRQQQAALMAQPTLDARAAETLRQQDMALSDQASRRMLQARLDSAGVLSADQRAQLQTRMQQRRGLMERQRAERRQLDGAAR